MQSFFKSSWRLSQQILNKKDLSNISATQVFIMFRIVAILKLFYKFVKLFCCSLFTMNLLVKPFANG